MQRLSKAAVVFDAKAIKKGAISLKQQACHVRPAAVMGAMAAANAGPLHGVSSAVLVVCCSVSSVCSCFISCEREQQQQSAPVHPDPGGGV
eukprot:scaffold12605_cov114-Isochrysis_galbana.AAC.6